MTRIVCARCECKYNKNFVCKAKEINLSDHSVMTLHDGRQDFLKCRNFELSDFFKSFDIKFSEISKEKENEHN